MRFSSIVPATPTVFFTLSALLFTGCAATQVALEHRTLDVQTKMSNTVFLDLENRIAKTIYVDIKNTSDKNIEVEPIIRERLQARGYTITPTPQEAFYILQANILYCGKADPSAIRDSLYAGWGGALGGGLAGAMVGGATHGYKGVGYGAGIGALAGGAAELIAGSLVKNVTYTIITDIQVAEQTPEVVEQRVESELAQGTGTTVIQKSEGVRTRRKYQTRIASTANKVNLRFEEAQPVIVDGLAKSIAGVF